MKLSKDQVRIIKSGALYACTVIVFYPLAMLALGKAMSWSDFFVFAGIMIAIVALLGAFLVLGSRTPDK